MLLRLNAGRLALPLAVAGALSACGERPVADVPAEESVAILPAVEFIGPADGDTVSLPFTIRLGATGVIIAPATGIREMGIAHHHLLFNVEPSSDDAPIPAEEGYVHLGSGVSEYVVEDLPPGVHQIIAILAWGDHVPILAAMRDTVRVVVR